MLKVENITKTTAAFKILSDPTRVRILTLLSKADDGLCVNELADLVEVSQSAMSHQLSKLEARGIVACFRQGQQICYKLQKNTFTNSLIKALTTFQRA